MHLISIIIPCFNIEKFINNFSSSIFNQTYQNIEYIFIDDCSTDDTFEKLKALKQNNPDLQIIVEKNEKNLTVGPTRNYGLSLASGKYVFFMDADDSMQEDMIERLYNCAEKESADVVYCAYTMIKEDNKFIEPISSKVIKAKNSNIKNFALNFNAAPWCKLVRKDFLGKNNISFPSIRSGQDICWTLQLVLKSSKIAILNEPLYNYTLVPNSLSSTNGKNLFSILEVISFNQAYIQQNATGYTQQLLLLHNHSLLVSKFISHYKRLPVELHDSFCQAFVQCVHENNLTQKLLDFSFLEKHGFYRLLPKNILPSCKQLRSILRAQYKTYQQMKIIKVILAKHNQSLSK